MKLNCDLGESYGPWVMGCDEAVMPYIHQANVACGFHASDPDTMARTVALATRYGVTIGAHPAYHDLVGFGRRSIPHTGAQVQALIWYQAGALSGICRAQGVDIGYIKPHGALYNDMMRDEPLLRAVLEAAAMFRKNLPVVLAATPRWQQHQTLAAEYGVPVWFEAFADRAYDDTGALVPRTQPGAVYHDPEAILEQALSLHHKKGLRSITGTWLELPSDTLCVHGDNERSVAVVARIRSALEGRP
ncbi:MAG: LamB/YcsF family protein [Marinobacter sp.]|nr:LamB/YcsF family protein [Marinobacter sp.]